MAGLGDGPNYLRNELDEELFDEMREDAEDAPRGAPEPPQHVEGAQWDEVHSRWIRWDAAADAWVPVDDSPAAGDTPADAASDADS
jgi:hypothetical protein